MIRLNIEAILATLGEADVDYRDGNVNMVVNPTMYADLLITIGSLELMR